MNNPKPLITVAYTDANRKAIIAELRRAAARANPTPDAFDENLSDEEAAALERIRDAAAWYLSVKEAYPTWPSFGAQKDQLRDIETAATKFLKAASNMLPALWFSIMSRTNGLPDEDADALQEYFRGDSDVLDRAFRNVRAIRQGAQRTRESIGQKRSNTAPRETRPLRDFIGRLAVIYEGAIGKKAGVSTYGGKRGGPFVRFVTACLRPIDPAACTSALGDQVRLVLKGRN